MGIWESNQCQNNKILQHKMEMSEGTMVKGTQPFSPFLFSLLLLQGLSTYTFQVTAIIGSTDLAAQIAGQPIQSFPLIFSTPNIDERIIP
jgi:hypothetical protein